jgi:hypothetical protein
MYHRHLATDIRPQCLFINAHTLSTGPAALPPGYQSRQSCNLLHNIQSLLWIPPCPRMNRVHHSIALRSMKWITDSQLPFLPRAISACVHRVARSPAPEAPNPSSPFRTPSHRTSPSNRLIRSYSCPLDWGRWLMPKVGSYYFHPVIKGFDREVV